MNRARSSTVRRPSRLLGPLAGLALVIAGAVPAVGSGAQAAAIEPTEGCVTDGAAYQFCGTAGTATDTLLFDDVAAKLGRTVKGDKVRIAMYTWKWGAHPGLEAEVVSADRRGVNIKVLLGSKAEKNKKAYKKFVKALGAKDVRYCGATDNGACLSREPGPGLMHAKFVTIRSGASTRVIQLSSNVTAGQFAKAQNSITVHDDPVLHDAYFSYWKQMAKKKWAWSDAQQEQAGAPGVDMRKAYFFPRAKEDPLVRVINNNSCDAEGDQIRLAVSQDIRPALVKAVQAAHRRGCFVRVTASTQAAANSILNAPGNRINAKNVQVMAQSHNKIAYLRETQGGQLLETVFTGSHNSNNHSLRRANDVMLRVRNPWVAQTYRDYLLTRLKQA